MQLCGKCDGNHARGHCLGLVPLGDSNLSITVEANQDPDCLTLRYSADDESEDLIHICDWPTARAIIDAFQAARASSTPSARS